jgi:hypothetical protein
MPFLLRLREMPAGRGAVSKIGRFKPFVCCWLMILSPVVDVMFGGMP